MDLEVVLIFLSSGLFLGWSLGANDAANVFGTAVATRMVRFTTAAVLCSIFIILGSVIGGSGAAHGLNSLGAVNAIAGSFMCALSAAATVFWMTKLGLPVSTTQGIVGAIIGWNLFSGSITDIGVLTKIVGTWFAAPILGAIFAALIYRGTQKTIAWWKPHILRLDSYTRLALIFAGILGSYSLGANNIANVMGVFVSSSPFTDFTVGGSFRFTGIQQLFLLGSVAIAVGVFTYSKQVMMTVGDSLYPLTPVGAFVVVVTQSAVLFLFSSSGLEHFLISNGLPAIPLIPVSSSQVVIGAVMGIGMLKGVKGVRLIKWGVLLRIGSGWISTPIMSGILSFVLLFFLQNVFNQTVYIEAQYRVSASVLEHLRLAGLRIEPLKTLEGQRFFKGIAFRRAVRERMKLDARQEALVISSALVHPIRVDLTKTTDADKSFFSQEQYRAIEQLGGRTYQHKWQLAESLGKLTPGWRKKEASMMNKKYNRHIQEQLDYLYGLFGVPEKRP